MIHSPTSEPERVATALLDFARTAAQTSIIAIRGDVSTPCPLVVVTTISLVNDEARLVLVGENHDAAFAGVDAGDVARMLNTPGTCISYSTQNFPLYASLRAWRPSTDVFILEAARLEPRAGIVGRLMLVIDRSVGVVTTTRSED